MALGTPLFSAADDAHGLVPAVIHGFALNHTTIISALAAIGSEEKTLLITPGIWIIDDIVTTPEHVHIKISPGVRFIINNPAILTFLDPHPEIPLVRIWNSGDLRLRRVYPQWFGALVEDSLDDQPAIQAAVSCVLDGGEVIFTTGTYMFGAAVTIQNRKRLTFRSEGKPILKRLSSASGTTRLLSFEGGSTEDMTVEGLYFDLNGIQSFGGAIAVSDGAKRFYVSRNRIYDSALNLTTNSDHYAIVFASGTPGPINEDIYIQDNIVEDATIEVDSGRRVYIERNIVRRPLRTTGIGAFAIQDGQILEDYFIRSNTIEDPGVNGDVAIAALLDVGNDNVTFQRFHIEGNRIIHRNAGGTSTSSIMIGSTWSDSHSGNIFQDFELIENEVYYLSGSQNPSRGGITLIDNNVSGNIVFTRVRIARNRVVHLVGNNSGNAFQIDNLRDSIIDHNIAEGAFARGIDIRRIHERVLIRDNKANVITEALFFDLGGTHTGSRIVRNELSAATAIATLAGTANNFFVDRARPTTQVIGSTSDQIAQQWALILISRSGGNITLSSTPTIRDGAFDGQVLIVLIASGSNTITVQDESGLAGSNIQTLSGSDIIMAAGLIYRFQWISQTSLWYQL